MGKSSQYNHYMKRVDVDNQPTYNIENQFTGLLYMRTDGINNIGKPKNIYTETYAENDSLRVCLPKHESSGAMVHSLSDIANEATKITMHFLVVGVASQRQTTIKNFFDYIRAGVHRYWDDARNLEFDFIVTEDLTVSDEKWHGSAPYIEISVPMQNINGKTRTHTS